ncbi:hypothetical protein AALO_G00092330 [Alosa alosa]|uniref:Uncharacterized protein n=1 Tax=Alosa alosa TaxID=278164 RepID=A0AAV6GRT7_9TELE|nr:hypothetical protein AALO_G00092330 [Alosa alosa]
MNNLSNSADFDTEVMQVCQESSILDVDVVLNIDSPLQMHSSTSPSRSVKELYAKGPLFLKRVVNISMTLTVEQDTSPGASRQFKIEPQWINQLRYRTGHLAWGIKTVQKKASEDQATPTQNKRRKGGPASERDVTEPELNEEQLKEAIPLMEHAT